MESKYEYKESIHERLDSPPLPELLVVAENLPQMTQDNQENTPVSRLKKEVCDNIPDDCQSSSSLNSDLKRLEDNILSIAEQVDNQSKFSVEPHPPSPAVACIFAAIYSVLGLIIVITIILTILYNFSMIVLISIVIIIFIAIVIVTNFCVIVYQY